MHDTAFSSGRLFFEAYLTEKQINLLDVGAMDVNGSLRGVAQSDWNYVGLDLEPGPGVDVVIAPNSTFPFQDQSFDAVLSTSCFEHDDMFWVTFLEMCRVVKRGGFVYVSAPSNGTYHRFPQDNWRFYPDSGEALARWARRNGYDIHLCESGTLGREGDFWNDYVAVYRHGEAKLPEVRMLARVNNAANIRYDGSDEVERFSLKTEDMLLLDAAREKLAHAEERLAPLNEIAAYAPLPPERLRVISEAFQIAGSDADPAIAQVGALARALDMHTLTIAELRKRLDDEQIIRRERDELHQVYEAALKREIDLRSHVAHLERQLLEEQAKTALLSKANDDLQRRLAETTVREADLRAHAEKLGGDFAMLQRQAQERAQELEEDRERQAAQLSAMRADIEQLQSEKNSLGAERLRLTEQIERVLAESAAMRQQIEALGNEKTVAHKKVQRLEKSLETLTLTHDHLQQVHAALGAEIETVRSEMARISDELDVARRNLTEARSTADHLQEERNTLLARLEAENMVSRQLREERQQLEQILASRDARVAAIETSASWKITAPIRRAAGLLKGR